MLQRSSVINKIDAEFKSIYEHQFVNFDNENTRFDYLVDQGNMLVICYDDFMNTMTPFVDWKNRKGIPTEMVGVSEIGSNSSSIEAYVENYYYENGCRKIWIGKFWKKFTFFFFIRIGIWRFKKKG